MKYKKITALLLAGCCNYAVMAQNFVLNSDLPVTHLTDTTNFGLLNSRLGSRFSLSLSNEKRSMQTGSLGFDMDEQSGLLVMVEYNKKKYCLRTTSLPRNAQYLNDQQLRFGPTSMEIKGKTDEGLELKFTLVSTFTKSKDLKDIAAIKTQIFPGFYLLTEIYNPTGIIGEMKLKIGFNRTPTKTFNFMALETHGAGDQKIYFRDNADLNDKTVLAAQGAKAESSFNEDGFAGLYYQFKLPSNEKKTFTQVYAVHHDGLVITDQRVNQNLRFYYTQYWKNVDEVLKYGLENFEQNLRQTQQFEDLLMDSKLSPSQKWALALTFHNDIANSFFLVDELNQPRFYLVEGRFEHLSTVDVAHETELMALFCPWRLKLQLEQWTHYIARKESIVKPNPTQNKGEYSQGITAAEFGPFLYHDVGDLPFVSETANYNFGPQMAVEENTSFVLLLYWYWKVSKDDDFVKSMLGTTDELLQSVINRDDNGNGIVDIAYGWTTYDTNEALRLSPDNTYLGVKQLAAYVVAAEMFKSLISHNKTVETEGTVKLAGADGEGVGFNRAAMALNNEVLRYKQAEKYIREANRISGTLHRAAKRYGYIPLSLNNGFPKWDQRSVMLGEGLFLPGLAGCQSPILKKVAMLLAKDYPVTYEMSKTDYGIKLSTAEDPTWFSKTMVADVVASQWYGIHHSSSGYLYELNKNNPNAYNDGFLSKGKPWTGFWYPRGVSSLGYWLLKTNYQISEAK